MSSSLLPTCHSTRPHRVPPNGFQPIPPLDVQTAPPLTLPVLTFQYELQGIPVMGFKGFVGVTGTPHTGNIMHSTNVHEWEMR